MLFSTAFGAHVMSVFLPCFASTCLAILQPWPNWLNTFGPQDAAASVLKGLPLVLGGKNGYQCTVGFPC